MTVPPFEMALNSRCSWIDRRRISVGQAETERTFQLNKLAVER